MAATPPTDPRIWENLDTAVEQFKAIHAHFPVTATAMLVKLKDIVDEAKELNAHPTE